MNCSFSLSDLVARVDIVENAPKGRMDPGEFFPPMPSSHNWVVGLVSYLKTSGTNIAAVCAVLHRVFSSDTKLEGLRYYFSRVPVVFTYALDTSKSPPAYFTQSQVVLSREGQKYEIGSQTCPREYFEGRLETQRNRVSTGTRVWGLYPPKDAKRLSFPIIPTWEETDSVIDWLLSIVEIDVNNPSVSLSCHRQGDDIIYQFRDPSVVPSSTSEDIPVDEVVSPEVSEVAPVPPVVDTAEVSVAADEAVGVDTAQVVSEPDPPTEILPAKKQIYRFIQEHGDTPIDAIRTQKIASERHTYRLLSQLVNEDRLERVGHGVYRAIQTEPDEDGKTD